MKKQRKTLFCILGVGILFAIWLFAVYGLGTRTYSSQEKYESAGGETLFSIPENAVECRFAIRKTGVGRFYLYAFTLDAQSYASYLAEVVQKYKLKGEAETEEEKSDEKYGYRQWYGKKVADCRDREYSLDDFPTVLPFSEVTDGSIEDYVVIVYRPYGTSGGSFAMVTDEAAGRIVVYSAYTM